MAPAISLHDVVALAGRYPLLAGVTLEVAEGQVVHLRGPNGAGKTSLLRACAGLLPLQAGRAEVLGHDLRLDRRSVRREVSLLGHASFLYEDLSVEENLRFALRAQRVPLSRLDAALERLGLGGRLRRLPVGQLSAGQRRRAAIALVVARGARLWLLDEPHAGLDAAARDVLDDLVRESRARGRTVVLCSHEHERAAALADRVVLLTGGRVAGEEGRLEPFGGEGVVAGVA
jgi:heme ABC exporter ATP-binding subunit CcmA